MNHIAQTGTDRRIGRRNDLIAVAFVLLAQDRAQPQADEDRHQRQNKDVEIRHNRPAMEDLA